MSDTFVLILFFVLLLGVIAARPSIAIICWLISGHIDLGVGSIGGGGTQKGIFNSVKVIGFPFLLYLRNWRVNFRNIKLNTTILFWLALLFYATISLIWTPEKYTGAGIKQVGYLLAYTIGFFVLYDGWRNNRLTTKSIVNSNHCSFYTCNSSNLFIWQYIWFNIALLSLCLVHLKTKFWGIFIRNYCISIYICPA